VKHRASIILLILLSVAFTYALVEIIFRTLLFSNAPFMAKFRDASLYADYFSDTNFMKLQFAFHPEWKGDFQPHPLLGWRGQFPTDGYRHDDMPNLKDRRPILIYGDSFLACGAVSEDCVENRLNAQLTDQYALNYAVRGYGVDQMYLLMHGSVPLYEKPLVIIGIMTYDLDRSILSVFTYPKPQIVPNGDGLAVIPPDTQMDLDPHIASYLHRLYLHTGRPYRPREEWLEGDRQRARKKEINAAILHQMIQELRENKIEPLFVILEPMETVNHGDWRGYFLLETLRAEKADYLIASALILQDGKALQDYYLPDDHPSAYQLQVIAQKLAHWIEEQP